MSSRPGLWCTHLRDMLGLVKWRQCWKITQFSPFQNHFPTEYPQFLPEPPNRAITPALCKTKLKGGLKVNVWISSPLPFQKKLVAFFNLQPQVVTAHPFAIKTVEWPGSEQLAIVNISTQLMARTQEIETTNENTVWLFESVSFTWSSIAAKEPTGREDTGSWDVGAAGVVGCTSAGTKLRLISSTYVVATGKTVGSGKQEGYHGAKQDLQEQPEMRVSVLSTSVLTTKERFWGKSKCRMETGI